MTNSEYAIQIYLRVFNKALDNGDAYVRGILDAVDALEPRERMALDCHYRLGQSLVMTGIAMWGSSPKAAKNAIDKAFLKLRNPSRHKDMSVSAMLERRDNLLADASAKIEKLYESLELLISGAPIDPVIQAELDARKQSVCELGFSTRTYNHLLRAGIRTTDVILKLETLEELVARPGFGVKSRDELLSKMREHGYDDWADRMELEISIVT